MGALLSGSIMNAVVSKSQSKFSWMLWVGLAITLGLTVWQALQKPETPEVVEVVDEHHENRENRPISKQSSLAIEADVTHLASDEKPASDTDVAEKSIVVAERTPLVEENIVDVFEVKKWYIPPPPPKPVAPPPPPPPPPPQAPPLTFTYIGKLDGGEQTVVYLARQNRNFAIKVGDVIENTYSVDSISSNAVVFTYLPLKIKQTLVLTGNR